MSRDWTREELNAASEMMKQNGHMGFEEFCHALAAATEMMAPSIAECSSVKGKTLQEYMKAMDKSFAYKLFDWIDARGMTDVECYKRANVDKKTFSKIKCNPQTYKPSKQTAVAFAIALPAR